VEFMKQKVVFMMGYLSFLISFLRKLHTGRDIIKKILTTFTWQSKQEQLI
jgi:hypothetical protein